MKTRSLPKLAIPLFLFGAAMPAAAMVQGIQAIAVPATKTENPVAGPADPFRLATRDSRTQTLLAHAILVKAAPDKEATITESPEEVLLIFNEGVGQEYLALAVVDESGKRVDKHDAKLDFTDRSHLRATVGTLNPGRYMVRYRVLSADGHVVSGKYFFQMHDAKGERDHESAKKQ